MTHDAATHARRYGSRHRALRKQWAAKVALGNVRCCRCHTLIVPGTKWHLDHLPGSDTEYMGPSHATPEKRCNESGILPGQPVPTHQAPVGPGRGRITADERVRRSLPRAGTPGHNVNTAPAGNGIRDGGTSRDWTGGVPHTHYLNSDGSCSTCPGGIPR